MTTKNENPQVVVAFPAAFVLFCIFLTLQLTGVIAWPWIWVFAPLWIPLALFLIIFVVIMIVIVIKDRR